MTVSSNRVKWMFLAPAMIYMLLLTLYPFIYSLILSTTRNNLARVEQQGFVGLNNYIELLTTSLFQKAIVNTFLIAALSILLELFIGYIIARLFFIIRDIPGSGLIRTVYILPMMVTPVVSGLLFTYILNPTLGVANYVLQSVGLDPYAWFARANTALPTVVLVNSWQWGPFLMLLILAGLMSISKEQYEAAAIDGAGLFATIWNIELPSLRNIMVVGIMFRVIDNFRLFDIVYVATKGGPGDATEILSMYAYREMFQFFNIGYGSAIAVIILIIGVILSQILYRLIREEN
ncbi:MAG: sugar ABC transporter permease [Armatimonadetes bacterium]|nr:sugar ABC transporter permease [Anaerolineae bacterium]